MSNPWTCSVSIVVPVYNQAQHLDECLRSALAQTFPSVEIIVVDDGSTDNSWLVASKYQVQVIRQSNQGQAHRSGGPARNTGIRAALGEFILPLDADDWIAPDYLAKTVPLMQGKVGIVATDMRRFGAINDVVRAERRTLAQQLRANELPVTSLVRRQAVLDVGGYWQFGWEDHELWIKLLKAGWQVEVVNQALFNYRVAPGGLNDDQTRMRAELDARMRETS